MVIKRRVRERVDGFRNIVAASFDRNIVIVGEVDTGVGFGRVIWNTEEFTLDLWVWWTSNVLPVSPLTFS